MMLRGRIGKGKGHPPWFAECEVIGAFTQGATRKEAFTALKSCIEGLIVVNGGSKDISVTVTEIGDSGDGAAEVLIESSHPRELAGHVLRYQRELHDLSQADVAKKLGGETAKQSGYAPYERGERDPSLSKFIEMLAVVAPDLAITIAPRKTR